MFNLTIAWLKKLLIILSIAVVSSLFMGMTAEAATYKVVQGDSLYTIGNLFKTTSSTIIKQNNLTSSVIYPGQSLNIPGDVYTVKSGDSLYLIAKKYGITVYSLEKANNEWDGIIYPGQKLNLPGINTGTAQSVPATNTGVIPYTSSDANLLAKLIMAEAEGESYSAKVAVGAVVVNRVQSGQFPNTISAVIYQRINGYYQFSPVLNGTINNTPNQDCKNAASAALKGADPSNGALFYFDNSATNTWLWSKPVAARIDSMIFSY